MKMYKNAGNSAGVLLSESNYLAKTLLLFKGKILNFDKIKPKILKIATQIVTFELDLSSF